MTTSTILPTPHGVDTGDAPRAASFGSLLRRAARAVWLALEASGQARAMRELRALHGHWDIGDSEFIGRVRDGSAFLGSPIGSPHR